MKPAKFRLESVLQLYATREDQARADLGRAVQAREQAEAALAAARSELEVRTRAYADHRERRGFSAETHAQHWAALQHGQAACKVQETRIVAAKQVEGRARGVLLEARRKHETIRKLRVRHQELQRLEEIRVEEHALVDFFNANRNRRLRAEALEAGF